MIMKKFLAILLAIIVTVALGFTIFYLVRDNEEIYLSTSSLYVSKGDDFDIDINFKNKKSYTTYEIKVDKNTVVQYNEEADNFTALAGGYTKVLFRTSNVNYRNLDCVVYVGDGTVTSPFYVATAEQLMQIGKADAEGKVKYPLDAYYALRNDINLADLAGQNFGYWTPIGYDAVTGQTTPFTGQLDGRGYTISNLAINKDAYNTEVDSLGEAGSDYVKTQFTDAGFFAELGANAVVKNVKFDNASITGAYTNAGVVAGVANSADIERVEIKSATLNLAGTVNGGAVVGSLNTTVIPSTTTYTTASLDRVSANIVVTSLSSVFGGLAGVNNGAYIVYSYVTGNVELYHEYSSVLFGGIVGSNNAISHTVDIIKLESGASIKDCYTSLTFEYNVQNGNIPSVNVKAGMIIGSNSTTSVTKDFGTGPKTIVKNKIIGNYYNADTATITVENNTKTFVGVAEYYDNSVLQTYTDAEYQITGTTYANLKKSTTYKSHVTDGNVILWKFGTVWIEVENDLPKLDYAEQAVSPEIEGIEDAENATTVAEFIELLNDPTKNIIAIGADLDFADEPVWTPIDLVNKKIFANYDETVVNADGSKAYYRIKNITTCDSLNTPVTYASLFKTIDKDSELHNVIIEGARFTNGTHSAGFAIENNGGIYDSQIINSSIIGTVVATGIANTNNGTISMGTINVLDNNNNVVKKDGAGVRVQDTVIRVESSSQAQVSGNVYAAGITKLNNGSIYGATVIGNINDVHIKVVSDNTSVNALLAGAAIENLGSIRLVNVSFVSGSEGIKADGTFIADAAGLVVYAHGASSIVKSYVSSNIYTYNNNTSNSSVGLVTEIRQDAYVTQSGFYGVNKVIEGYNVAGFSILITKSDYRKVATNSWNALVGELVLSTSKAELGNGITESFVSGTTTLYGKNVAGFAHEIHNGAIVDSYIGTGITLKGIDGESVVANMAFDVKINRNNENDGKFQCGVIAYCYSAAKLDNAGTTYGVAKDDILLLSTTNQSVKTQGYGVGIIVSREYTDGATFHSDWWNVADWGKEGQSNSRMSNSDMNTTSDSNVYTDKGYDTSIWTFAFNQLKAEKGSDIGPALVNSYIDTAKLNIA